MSFVRDAARRLLPKGRFGRGVAALAGGTAAGQAIAILASPLLTRLYTPEDFGALGVFTSVIGVLSIVACLRFDLAIPLPESDADAANVGVVALISTIIVAGIVLLASFLFGDDLARVTNAPALAPFGWLSALGVLAIGVYQVLNYWAVRRRDYPRIARTKFTQGLSSVTVQLAASVLAGPIGLLLGQVTVHAAGGTSLGLAFWRRDRVVLSQISIRRMRAMVQRYRSFALVQTPASLLNATGLRLPPLLIASLFGASIAGMFALGTRVVATPVTFVGLSISQVYVGELSRICRTEPGAALRLYLTTAGRLLAIAVVPTALVIAAGPWLFSLLFGEQWRTAGVIIQALGAMYLAQMVVYPLSQTLVVLERQSLQLAWDAGRAILTVASLWIPYAMGAGPIASIATFGIAMAVAYVVHFLMMWWGLRQNLHAPAEVESSRQHDALLR